MSDIPFPEVPEPREGTRDVSQVIERMKARMPLDQALMEWHRTFSTVELKQHINLLSSIADRAAPLSFPITELRIDLMLQELFSRPPAYGQQV